MKTRSAAATAMAFNEARVDQGGYAGLQGVGQGVVIQDEQNQVHDALVAQLLLHGVKSRIDDLVCGQQLSGKAHHSGVIAGYTVRVDDALARVRRLAPELLVTARTQRWNPEELLRTLVEAEITARDESNARTRMRSAAFPVIKSLTEFDLASSSIPRATFDYLASLEWIRAA